MSERSKERVGGVSALIFLVLVFVSAFAVWPTPPALHSTSRTVWHYYLVNRSSVEAGVIMTLSSFVFFLWFLGALNHVLRRAEGGIGSLSNLAFASGVLTVGLLMVSFGLEGVAAFRAAQNGPTITRLMHDASELFTAPYSLALVPFFVSVGIVVLTKGGLPRWLGWFAIIVVPIRALSAASMLSDGGTFAADGPIEFIGTLVWFVWTAAAGATLIWGRTAAVASSPAVEAVPTRA